MVHVKVRSGQMKQVERLYRDRITVALAGTRGCRFAGMLQSARHPEDGISMTLWNSEEDARAYEASGLYSDLLAETKPFLSESLESTVRLSENLTLEYVPLPEEPVVRSLPVAATTDADIQSVDEDRDIWVRIVQLRIRAGKMQEFKKQYIGTVIPALRKVKGCRHVYLTELEGEPDVLASVTTWDSREDAEAYERSGLYDHLIEMQREFLSSLYEWKRHREGAGRPGVATSDDVVVELYTMLTGKSF
jgi:heme-degrading monooxygenase HmoA